MASQGEEVTRSHKVQSVRAVVEQTFADLKRAKVMESNKARTAADLEGALDCVIALHNLRVLLKADPDYDLPERRAAIPGEHIFKPLVPTNEVDLKIPADPPDLSLAKYRHIKEFQEFMPSAAGAIRRAMDLHGNECVFFSYGPETRRKPVQWRLCAAVAGAQRGAGLMDCAVPRGGVVQLRNARRLLPNVARQRRYCQHL
jgi:hypothetical protein